MSLPTLMALIQRSTTYLSDRGIAHARRETEWIFAETLGLSRLELYTQFDMPIAEDDVGRLRALVQRRGRREPLAYVLGTQDFHGLTVHVGPAVLVPRPETEELVDLVLAGLPPADGRALRVLDVGTGSGAIALALKHARPDIAVDACDISSEALQVAAANGERLGLAVVWRRADLGAGLTGPYQAVVANLPYIGDHERALCDPELAFEPQHALFSADGGHALMLRLMADAQRLLAGDGVLWLEHGFTQAARLRAEAHALGLACQTLRDGAGQERFARLTLEAVGALPPLA